MKLTNLHKTKHVTRMNVAMKNKNICERVFPVPLKCARAIALWFASAIISIGLQAGPSTPEVSGRFLELVVSLVAICLLTPVCALSYLCKHCDWYIAILAYAMQTVVLLVLSKAKRRWLQAIGAILILVQSFVGVHGLIHSI